MYTIIVRDEDYGQDIITCQMPIIPSIGDEFYTSDIEDFTDDYLPRIIRREHNVHKGEYHCVIYLKNNNESQIIDIEPELIPHKLIK